MSIAVSAGAAGGMAGPGGVIEVDMERLVDGLLDLRRSMLDGQV